MRARAKAAKQFFCGEPRSYTSGLMSIKLICATEPIEALFLYVEERAKGHDPLKPGKEVVVFEATTSETFVLIGDEDSEPEIVAQIVENYAPETAEQAGD